MSTARDRELLVAFVEWAGGYYGDGEHVTEKDIDAFLASREPAPPTTEPPYDTCPRCGSANFRDVRVGHRMCLNCTFIRDPAPQATEQWYWRVCQRGWGNSYTAYVCRADGTIDAPLGAGTRAEAEADGRASGLPEWRKP